MATSNRDRVGRGFEILAAGLERFVDDHMSAAAPDGKDWVELLEARDAVKHRAPQKRFKTDPQLQLRVLTEEWRVFSGALSRSEQSFATELRDTRNKWAHNEPFSSDDTYRALDTMERLLTAAGAMDAAEEVRQLRRAHQRELYDNETRKAAKAASAFPTVEGQGLKPWREVIRPHRDVASGNFAASEFAADLYAVAHGQGSEEYLDPVQFFRRTYLTEGLRDLLGRAVRRIGGDANAAPIVNLQTNFGGGKTHSMLALYHLFAGRELTELPQDVQELLAGHEIAELGRTVKRVTLVGNHIEAGKADEKDDGTKVGTMWGELAWQLGGRAAYDMVAEADRTATNPGAALRTLIAAYAPCLILIDEWVAYARQLYGRDDLVGGTFETQFTFAQTLTEVVKSVPGALLVISIPASHDVRPGADLDGPAGSNLEVGGPNGQAALRRLQNVIRRVADQWRPATAYESFEIVRRRLFDEPDGSARADINAVARAFVRFYAEHRGEFPSACGEGDYERRIKAAYPIHPELFDRLYEDWSTLERFQRTRGVLRLMSAVVHALWAAGDAAPLIMPGSLPVGVDAVQRELVQYLEDSWPPVIDTDIDGDNATPVLIDVQRTTFGQRGVTRRIARTVFLGSAATLRSAHKGIDRQKVWLGVAMPGDTVGNFGSALHVLADRATYLYADGERYWYDTQASVSRTAKDYAERLRERPEEVFAEIVRRLKKNEERVRGDFAGVHVAADDTGDIPDLPEARLVIMHPRHPHTKGDADSSARRFAAAALESRGSAQRVNRNMLVFLAPDSKRMDELTEAVREYLAWKNINGRKEELNLAPQQARQAETRLGDADHAVTLRIAAAYMWAIVPVWPAGQPRSGWEVVKAEGSEERLAKRTSDKLRQSDLIRVVQAPRLIHQDLTGPLQRVWEAGHIAVGELWSYYCRYTYLARLRDRSVLDAGVLAVLDELTWEREGFALAQSYDESTGRYVGLTLPHEDTFGQVTDATLLVRPERTSRQREAERPEPGSEGDGGDAGSRTTDEGGTFDETGERTGRTEGGRHDAPPAPSNVRFFGAYRVNPERYARDLNKLSQEILPHLADEDVELEITVEIRARKADGFDPATVRTVTENARQLRFEPFGFEDH